MKGFLLFFENFDHDFGTLGIEIAKIGVQTRARHPRIRLYANFGRFSFIISLKNNQLACFFLSLCTILQPHENYNRTHPTLKQRLRLN